MAKIGELFQTADWKSEKHVPVIKCPNSVQTDEFFDVQVTIGEEISHPNTTEHHIRWIRLFFKPEDDKFSYDVGCFEFNAHGENVAGPDEGPVYTDHRVTVRMKTKKSGILYAAAYCNIHGLWENSTEIQAS